MKPESTVMLGKPQKKLNVVVLALIAIVSQVPGQLHGQFVVNIETHKDASFYAAGFDGGVPGVTENNMGMHTHCTVGKANNDRISRAVFEFEFNDIISDQATITNVGFEFQVMQQGGVQGSSPVDFELHPVLSPWDEGSGTGNTGEPTGDGVTWLMATSSSAWLTPGGDFGDSMGSVFVDGTDDYSIQSVALVEWTQQVLVGAQENYGLLLKANPETVSGSASRVSSREAGGDAPATLVIEFELDPLLGDINLDGSVNLLDVALFVQRVFDATFQPEADCNMDGQVDLLDVGPFVDLLVG